MWKELIELLTTAAPDGGNPLSSTCTQRFSITYDNTNPSLHCPDDFSVQCLEDVPTCNANNATATDNCDMDVDISCMQGDLMGDACGGTISNTYTATDDCGNTSSCEQIITVEDNTPPTIMCPYDFTVQCVSEVPACDYPNEAYATDNCDDDVELSCMQGDLEGGVCGGTVTRIYTATDDCGNTATCSRVITVNDNTPPSIICPDDFSVDCLEGIPECNPNDAMATDNCDMELEVSCMQSGLTGDICGGSPITNTYTAMDDCGNTASCEQSITIDDNTPPKISCPDGFSVECLEDVPDCNVDDVTATDNCDMEVDVSCTQDDATGSSCEGQIINTYTATDDCGNTNTCEQIITISDTTPPSIKCPADFSIECLEDIEDCNSHEATATDNCDMMLELSCMQSDLMGDACGGTITNTYTATDDCGNTASCQQTISIDDTTAPDITCPEGFSVECIDDIPPCDAQDAMATDNCDMDVHISCSQGDLVGNTCEGTIMITYIAEDDCGNAAICQQRISISDTQAPMGTCPDLDQMVDCVEDIPCDGEDFKQEIKDAFTDCNEIVVELIDDTGEPLCTDGLASRTFTYEVRDICGNVAGDCEVTITAPCFEFCTFTMGFYGNSGGTQGGLSTTEILDILLDLGPITVGDGVDCGFSVDDAACIIGILPSSGPSRPFSSDFNGNLDCKSRFRNTLIGQVITLKLNIRYNDLLNGGLDLGGLDLDEACFDINPNILDLLNNLGLPTTIDGLLELADRFLASNCTTDDFPNNLGGALASIFGDINEYWHECQQPSCENLRTLATNDNSLSEQFVDVSSSNQTLSKDFSIFPNPTTSSSINVQLHDFMGQNISILVFNAKGESIFFDNNNLLHPVKTLNISHWPNGLYIVQVITESASINKKFIIAKP